MNLLCKTICVFTSTVALIGSTSLPPQKKTETNSATTPAPSVAKNPFAVEPFALDEVKLLPSRFKSAMERNANYLLEIDSDRLLHNTRKYAGLEPKAALYGGWEARGVAGHILGHYLTALSQQYATTGDARFQKRIAYIVDELAQCQKAYGDGYVGALPPLELETLRGFKKGIVDVDGSFNFKGGAWVPLYTQHKVLTGLKDAWVLTGNTQAKEVMLKLADWIDEVTRNLTSEQQQRMLRVEHGGMSETLADIYALTNDEKYLTTARRFYHESILNPLLEGRDELAGKHANTQIPKVIGQARIYEVAGDPNGEKIARFFWDRVVNHHSYVIGGNSENEHFGLPDHLSKRLGPATAESCNTYNMLKLTRHLFEWQPDAKYLDFYERALYNHILGSQEPKRGMFAYFMSLKPGHFKTFSTPENSFWCCVGTGIENHTKYNDSIYFHGTDSLYVNLFIPSKLIWKKKGLELVQQTTYPDGNQVTLRFRLKRPEHLSINIRTPEWATDGLRIQLNGKRLSSPSSPGSYVRISRAWRARDVLQITIPMRVRTAATPDNPEKVAFLYGPLVLAGDLGRVPPSRSFPYAADQNENFRQPVANVPAIVTSDKDLAARVKRIRGRELVFRIPNGVLLRPFNEIFYNYYNIYWDVFTPDEYAKRKVAQQLEASRQAELDARTVDEYRPGEQQSEVDHQQRGEKSSSGEWQSRKFRHAEDGGWFSFNIKVPGDQRVELVCTYWGGELGKRTFDIVVGGKVIATESLHQDLPEEFFEKSYAIPQELIRGKERVEVRFQAHPGNFAGGLFGARVVKAKA
jgi:uncharacterized protein